MYLLLLLSVGIITIVMIVYTIIDGIKNKPEWYVMAIRGVACMGAIVVFILLLLPLVKLLMFLSVITD